MYTVYISKHSGMDHAVLPANTPCLPFLRKRSPDGATPTICLLTVSPVKGVNNYQKLPKATEIY